MIVAHLGSGASLCAMKARKSVDCSMGFTALDGLCMGTRPGSMDPGVVLHLFQTLGMSPAEVETLLYKKSGLLGLSGISNDMRDLVGSPDPRAQQAVDYFVYQAVKQIGALAAVLGGGGRARLHGGHRRALGRDPAADLRRVGVARSRAGRRRERPPCDADHDAGQPRVRLGDPDQRGADDRPAHGQTARTAAPRARGPPTQGSTR